MDRASSPARRRAARRAPHVVVMVLREEIVPVWEIVGRACGVASVVRDVVVRATRVVMRVPRDEPGARDGAWLLRVTAW
jgi:hypothetical protein